MNVKPDFSESNPALKKYEEKMSLRKIRYNTSVAIKLLSKIKEYTLEAEQAFIGMQPGSKSLTKFPESSVHLSESNHAEKYQDALRNIKILTPVAQKFMKALNFSAVED